MVENVFVEEKSDALDVSGCAEAPFGVTLADAEKYYRQTERNALRVHNAPVRDVTKQSCLDFLLEPLPEEDEAALAALMRSVEEAFD